MITVRNKEDQLLTVEVGEDFREELGPDIFCVACGGAVYIRGLGEEQIILHVHPEKCIKYIREIPAKYIFRLYEACRLIFPEADIKRDVYKLINPDFFLYKRFNVPVFIIKGNGHRLAADIDDFDRGGQVEEMKTVYRANKIDVMWLTQAGPYSYKHIESGLEIKR